MSNDVIAERSAGKKENEVFTIHDLGSCRLTVKHDTCKGADDDTSDQILEFHDFSLIEGADAPNK